jgi:histidinol phosphatase-like enzyme
MLESAFSLYNYDKNESWMIGDRATDIIAGHSFGLKTALLGPSVKNDVDILNKENIIPTYHGKDLRDFIKYIFGIQRVTNGYIKISGCDFWFYQNICARLNIVIN